MWADRLPPRAIRWPIRRLICRVLAVLLPVLAATTMARPAAAADFDYCTAGQATSLLVVDRTTRFDTVDQDILISTVESFFRRQAAGDRVLVVAIGGAYTEIKPVFNECRPGCPDLGFLDRLTSTCRPVIARSEYLNFEARFIAVLRGLLANTEEAAASDLFRSVAEATRLVEANAYKPLRQMLMYSDLLEASSLFPGQTIRRMPAAEVLRRLAASSVQPRLSGARVRVIGFGRDDSPGRQALPQDIRHRVEESWDRWFKSGGATEVDIGLR